MHQSWISLEWVMLWAEILIWFDSLNSGMAHVMHRLSNWCVFLSQSGGFKDSWAMWSDTLASGEGKAEKTMCPAESFTAVSVENEEPTAIIITSHLFRVFDSNGCRWMNMQISPSEPRFVLGPASLFRPYWHILTPGYYLVIIGKLRRHSKISIKKMYELDWIGSERNRVGIRR